MPQALLPTTRDVRCPLSDQEIKAAVRRAMMGCHDNEELKRRIREALGYESAPAVTSTSIHCGPSTMTMVMLNGPRGNVISV